MEAKYVAEQELGRLTRWLRLLGIDVEYMKRKRNLEGDSFPEERKVITKRQDPSLKYFVRIEADRVSSQVKEFLEKEGIVLFEKDFFTRCSLCNSPLRETGKEEALSFSVPEFILLSTKRFLVCDLCGKAYWPGTHRARFLDAIHVAGIIFHGRGKE